MTPTPAAVELDNVSKVYSARSPVAALADLSFSVASGEVVSIVGPSGCGKSTMLRIVAGLLAPSAGRVRVGGRAPGPPCAFVFQENDLLPWRRALGNVLLGVPSATAPAEREAVAQEALRQVGLAEFANRFPAELSVGMRRRVSLARAVASGLDLWLMDEPFAAADALTRRRLQRQLLELWAARRPTVLFVTHDVSEAIVLGRRVLVLSGRPARLLASLPAAPDAEAQIWDLLEARD